MARRPKPTSSRISTVALIFTAVFLCGLVLEIPGGFIFLGAIGAVVFGAAYFVVRAIEARDAPTGSS